MPYLGHTLDCHTWSSCYILSLLLGQNLATVICLTSYNNLVVMSIIFLGTKSEILS